MVKKRLRFKQTTSLSHRLAEQAARLRDRARTLSPGPEQAEIWRKLRQTETALRMDQWLASPDAPPPANATSARSTAQGKHSPDKSRQGPL